MNWYYTDRYIRDNFFTIAYFSLALGLLLVIKSVFYNTSLYTALLICAIPPCFVVWISKNEPEKEKLWLLVFGITLTFFTVILATVIKFFYVMLTVALIIAQDIAFKLMHYMEKKELFSIFRNRSLKNFLVYIIPVLFILYGAYTHYPEKDIENLRLINISSILLDNFNITQLWNISEHVNTFGNSVLSSLKENILKQSGYLVLICFSIYPLKFFPYDFEL